MFRYSVFYKKSGIAFFVILGIFLSSSAFRLSSPSPQSSYPSDTLPAQDAPFVYDSLTEKEKRYPEFAVAGLDVAEGLEATLFASEPIISNPTSIDVDHRGRVWVCDAYNYRPRHKRRRPAALEAGPPHGRPHPDSGRYRRGR